MADFNVPAPPPPLNSRINQRAATLPLSLPSSVSPRSPTNGGVLQSPEEGKEILFSYHSCKIVRFVPPGRTRSPRRSSHVRSPSDKPEEPVGTLPWTCPVERTMASGPVTLYRDRTDAAFLQSGSFLHPTMTKSVCWCVDGASKFVLKTLGGYYRIELPFVTKEDETAAANLKVAFARVLQYETTECPFERWFHVPLPERAEPTTKPWKPKHSPITSRPVEAEPMAVFSEPSTPDNIRVRKRDGINVEVVPISTEYGSEGHWYDGESASPISSSDGMGKTQYVETTVSGYESMRTPDMLTPIRAAELLSQSGRPAERRVSFNGNQFVPANRNEEFLTQPPGFVPCESASAAFGEPIPATIEPDTNGISSVDEGSQKRDTGDARSEDVQKVRMLARSFTAPMLHSQSAVDVGEISDKEPSSENSVLERTERTDSSPSPLSRVNGVYGTGDREIHTTVSEYENEGAELTAAQNGESASEIKSVPEAEPTPEFKPVPDAVFESEVESMSAVESTPEVREVLGVDSLPAIEPAIGAKTPEYLAPSTPIQEHTRSSTPEWLGLSPRSSSSPQSATLAAAVTSVSTQEAQEALDEGTLALNEDTKAEQEPAGPIYEIEAFDSENAHTAPLADDQLRSPSSTSSPTSQLRERLHKRRARSPVPPVRTSVDVCSAPANTHPAIRILQMTYSLMLVPIIPIVAFFITTLFQLKQGGAKYDASTDLRRGIRAPGGWDSDLSTPSEDHVPEADEVGSMNASEDSDYLNELPSVRTEK